MKIIRKVISDFNDFKWYEVFTLLILLSITITLSIIDINYFFGNSGSLLIWYNNDNNNIPLWKNIISVINGFGATIGVLAMILATKGKISNFIWAILSSIIYCIFNFSFGYIGGFQIETLFLLPMRFIGLYLWSKHMDSKNTVIVKNISSIKKFIIGIIIAICIFVFFFFEIPFLSEWLLDKQYYFYDNLIARIMETSASMLSILVHICAMNRYLEQWIFRILNCIIQIILFSGTIGFPLTANVVFMWLIILVISITSLILWIRRMIEQNKTKYDNLVNNL